MGNSVSRKIYSILPQEEVSKSNKKFVDSHNKIVTEAEACLLRYFFREKYKLEKPYLEKIKFIKDQDSIEVITCGIITDDSERDSNNIKYSRLIFKEKNVCIGLYFLSGCDSASGKKYDYEFVRAINKVVYKVFITMHRENIEIIVVR